MTRDLSYVCLLLGIQRPLKDINILTDSIYIPKGINTPALDRQTKWEFKALSNIKVGTILTTRTITAINNNHIQQHSAINKNLQSKNNK